MRTAAVLLVSTFAAALTMTPGSASAQVGLRPVGTFSSPTYVTAPPGDASRVFVVERRGAVRIVKRGRKLRTPFLDLRRDVLIRGAGTADQRGMLSLAFAPDYARSGRLYVFYVDRRDRIRVDELRRSATSGDRVQASARRTLLAIDGAGPLHHGGQLAFGPDGRLYVGIGFGDDPAAPQDPASPRGKILRLDPDEPSPQPEVFALGLRNPYRFSFDAPTKSLLIADVGEDDEEEMTRLPSDALPGANLGWSFVEGGRQLRPGAPPGLVPPTLRHTHRAGWCSIVGGHVARDPRLPRAVRGRYVYGDVCSGLLRTADPMTGSNSGVRGVRVPYLVSFGQDALRRLYAVSLEGGVWRIVAR
jgi:glucose/arabinose dehydrogenase